MTRTDLVNVVAIALAEIGGVARPIDVAKQIWATRESELKASGDLFYSWQYDMRWAAQSLRDQGKLNHTRKDGKSVWALVR